MRRCLAQYGIMAIALVAALLPRGAQAEGFKPVRSEQAFESLVEGRDLRRFGITLQVRRDGRIEGRALGRAVTGAWRWEDGYFCREMAWGNRDLGPNCQVVLYDGRSLRFVADEGKGESADLRLD